MYNPHLLIWLAFSLMSYPPSAADLAVTVRDTPGPQWHLSAWSIGAWDWRSVLEWAHLLFHAQRAGPAVSGIVRRRVHAISERHRQATGMLLQNVAILGG